jgi:hypothetical protein
MRALKGMGGRPFVAVLSIAVVAFLTYADVLGYFFTSTDTFTLIDTSRVSSIGDALTLFTEPLMAGAKSEECARFYRPLTALTYSMDYHNWGLNPFGYHLTDLSLHILTSVLVYFVVRALLSGEQVAAWLSAVIFSTHPILVEAVPGVAPRQELLVSLLLLTSFLLFLRSSSQGIYLVASLFAYLLALCAKEIAIILPLLVATYQLTSYGPEQGSLAGRIRHALRQAAPYLAVTIIFIGWRTWVLRGLGGYTSLFGLIGMARAAVKNIPSYFLDLFYPLDVLVFKYTSLFSAYPDDYSLPGILITISYLLAFLVLAGRVLKRTQNDVRTQVLKILIVSGVASAAAAIVTYPALCGYINKAVRSAYYGQMHQLSNDAMSRIHWLPVEYYYNDSKEIIIRFLAFTSLLLTGSLIWLWCRRGIASFLSDGGRRRFVAVMAVWLCSPLLVYVVTATFYHRCMYPSVIPFSSLLALVLIESLRAATRRIRQKTVQGTGSPAYGLAAAPAVACSAAALTLVLALLCYSPLTGSYVEWKDSGVLGAAFLRRLSGVVSSVPNDAVIDVYDYPQRISSYQANARRVKECGYGNEFSTKAWLNLTRPGNRVKVFFCRRSWPETARAADMRLDVREGGADRDRVAVFVTFDNDANPVSDRCGHLPASNARIALPAA